MYDKECDNLRLELNGLSKQICNDPLNVILRSQYNTCKKKYKKMLKDKEKKYSMKTKEILLQMEANNPAQFWKVVKDLTWTAQILFLMRNAIITIINCITSKEI